MSDLFENVFSQVIAALLFYSAEELMLIITDRDLLKLQEEDSSWFRTRKTLTGESLYFLSVKIRQIRGRASPVVVQRIF